MSPEEATKFKKQIQYFTEHPNDGILVKHGENKYWELVKYPNWCIEHKYVIPDKYQDFRMALADGKEIQALYHLPKTSAKWINIDNFEELLSKLEHDGLSLEDCHYNKLRIKPEEYKFQIGDWINGIRDDGTIFTARQFNHYDEGIEPPNGYTYELWEPVEGKWVVCSDDETEYIVKKFEQQDLEHYTHIFPLEFIQTLKG